MNERKISELQKEYRAFFLSKMKLYGVVSPAELPKKKKSEFFSEIKRDWTKFKEEKQRLKEKSKKQISSHELSKGMLKGHNLTKKGDNFPHKNKEKQLFDNKKIEPTNKTAREQASRKKSTNQVIKSKPNQEQTDDLRILFQPNSHFEQKGEYLYPVVKMPKHNAILKLPRHGRSNQKGYKEEDFYNKLKQTITDVEITNNAHMVIPHFNKPYEPDIVLFDKKTNLYIDIEIDEPYDGYNRYPTHFINPEQDEKQDDIRDLFFTESGWLVIRFTEKQIHCYEYDCIEYIKNILNSLYNRTFSNKTTCQKESQWDYNRCIQWQKANYREKYLEISGFKTQHYHNEIVIDINETESIENIIQRTKRFQADKRNSYLSFDEESHKYFHPKDETGNAEYISVTTLIERFFPFDLKRYIEQKAKKENRTEEEILDEYLLIRDEAAEKGTYLHNQIEKYLKKVEFDSDQKEFEYFLNFYNKEIMTRGLSFFDAEKMIFSNKYNVAGTIDCLFKKVDKNEYVMFDWKRSKNLIIDGQPKIFGYGYALSALRSLDNSSYNRYCLQQNIYKHIIETEYSMKVSSMKLVVLHENYSNYHVIDVPVMERETNIILNSLKVKI